MIVHNRRPLDPDTRRLHLGMRNAILLSALMWLGIGMAIGWAWR